MKFVIIFLPFLSHGQTTILGREFDSTFVFTLAKEDKPELKHHCKAPYFFLYKGYKKFFSSQDIPDVCRFSPSCSDYAVEYVKKKGLVVGTMEAFDRLTRCHGRINSESYQFDGSSRKYHDPVDE